ncbi:acyl-[acyl-carrier-protein] thioesterase [Maridesulfovibrio salexigens]|uniref:Acyl-ACP thioesterase n=1 Tax=Maridesulfovibrio salexigens (strain ATCC 14822 / DSM 2638 / NCIMB 8403 / VKM B-1763) TaxID=526222 RepID=C6BRH4_MARSD|nr:acyl-ACP thioesterase domain-containing protein [Maridesulfovibrio salexigens]ACS79414.1 acyl-ACP thioesterase [Maridesulfovibrio salexigens DSM 2638]
MSNGSLLISNTVPAYETGPDDRMHCHWLMCRLQEAATAHADSLGFGIEDMAKQGCFWVLTSVRIEIAELPLREKTFALTTWSRGAKKLRAFRDFSGCDENGREIIRASSEWMVLDSQTRRPIAIDQKLNLHAQDRCVFPDPMKRLRPGTPEKELRSLNVGYSSLDANGHVNNTEYLRWSFDGLRSLGFDQNNVKSIRVAFLSEVFEGNTIKLMDCDREDDGYELIGLNETEGKAAFALKVE